MLRCLNYGSQVYGQYGNIETVWYLLKKILFGRRLWTMSKFYCGKYCSRCSKDLRSHLHNGVIILYLVLGLSIWSNNILAYVLTVNPTSVYLHQAISVLCWFQSNNLWVCGCIGVHELLHGRCMALY